MAVPVARRFRGVSNVTPMHAANAATDIRAAWIEAYREVRGETERRAAPLSDEDQVVQSMPDASPTKWHRAHTTWFFEQFLLLPHLSGYRVFDRQFAYLFNSYYVGAGERYCRPKRGLLSRPTVAEVYEYRAHVDAHMIALLERLDASPCAELAAVVELGIHHEQQHQELLLTDIKMPVMDGIALALATARDHPEIVILLMTGYADQRERADGLDALIHDVLTKPFTLHDLKLSVRGALETRVH